MLLGSFLVIGAVLFLPVILGVTYAMSVTAGHTKPILPYISYTGNFPVESCIFSFGLNLTSGMYLAIVIIRYYQLSNAIFDLRMTESREKKMKKRNSTSLIFGMLGALGLSITGSFQQRLFHVVHVFGVGICMLGTHVYLIFQTYFSYTVMSASTRPLVKNFRFSLVLLASIMYICGLVFALYSISEHHRKKIEWTYSEQPKRESVYVIGAFLEWTLLGINLTFIVSYYPDFRKVQLKSDKIELVL